MTGFTQPPFQRAKRISTMGVSEVLEIGAKAAQLRREGHPVIVLGAGEPDFTTPEHVKEAAIKAIRENDTKYTYLLGTQALREAIQHKFQRDNHLHYEVDEICAGTGAKQVIHNAYMASLNEGDEVIIPSPYWTSYADIVAIAGGKVVAVPCTQEQGFRLTPDALEAAITPRTKWLMLNSPSNPSGAFYNAEQLDAILDVVRQHPSIWILTDDIYEHLLYDDHEFVTPAQLAPDLKSRILTVNGVSKAYAMTGWRIGYAGGSRDLIKAMATVQSQSTSNPSSISQVAAIAALTGPQIVLSERRALFQKRRDYVVEQLNLCDGLHCLLPEGAFYVFPSCHGVLGRKTPTGETLATDSDFCRYLLEHHYVAVVPGSSFGLAGHFRLSYAASNTELETACKRIQEACAQLR